MAQAERTQRYRPEIDGLRAIAVLAVVLFHAGVDYLPGGFVGVDVFFVISGYLITRNIVQMLADGTFTFRNFYLRRTKRLLPAATVTTLTTLCLGAWFLTPDAWIDLSESAIASALFVANFWFAQNSGYFDQATELSALVHMWSLAVEEQFYLLAPPALYVAYRRFGLAGVRWTVGVILAGSFSLSVGLSEGSPNES
ncbi:MAG: acyltransferase, partial [Myxococcota bacterium]